MADRKRIAQLLRMVGSSGGERRNAFASLERAMHCEGETWTDIGNAYEHAADDKYSKAEMEELAQFARVQGVEEGIKIGEARTQQRNGHIVLPEPAEMARYCHERLTRLKDDKQREFVSDMYRMTVRRMSLSLGRLGYLASIYIQIGGRI